MPDGPVKASINRAVNAHRNFEVEAAKIAANADLSVEGKSKAAREFAAKQAHKLLRIQKFAKRAQTRIAEKRAKLLPPSPDKTDAAGAVLRAQIRDRLAGKSLAELKATLPSAPMAHLQAVLEAPELVGADNELLETITTRAINIAHPHAAVSFERDREAVTMLNVAAQALGDMVKDVAALPNNAALEDFIGTAVPNQALIDRDVELQSEPLAA